MVFQTNELLPEVRALADRHPGSIILVGPLQHYEMKAIYDQADFIISTSHYEGSGVAVCEAMSRGCIPILSGIASFRMMTSNGEVGFLFQAGNPTSLQECLEKSLLVDKKLERQRVLKQFQCKLSFKAIADKMIQVIKAV
jgi:glycosyltransferase involved in cell wall biosynthesis